MYIYCYNYQAAVLLLKINLWEMYFRKDMTTYVVFNAALKVVLSWFRVTTCQ